MEKINFSPHGHNVFTFLLKIIVYLLYSMELLCMYLHTSLKEHSSFWRHFSTCSLCIFSLSNTVHLSWHVPEWRDLLTSDGSGGRVVCLDLSTELFLGSFVFILSPCLACECDVRICRWIIACCEETIIFFNFIFYECYCVCKNEVRVKRTLFGSRN